MHTFQITALIVISLMVIMFVILETHKKNQRTSQIIDKDIENIEATIDREMQDLEQKIEEFEL